MTDRCNSCGQFLADFDSRTKDSGADYHTDCWLAMMDAFRDEVGEPRFGETDAEFAARKRQGAKP